MAGSLGGTVSLKLDEPPARRRVALSWRRPASAALAVIACAAGPAAGVAQAAFSPRGASATRALYAGIPQDGVTLGRKGAAVTLVEFAAPLCPTCGSYSRNVLPDLIRRYVRPGRIKMELRTLAFGGAPGLRAARVAAAAGRQDRMWQFTDLMYRNLPAAESGVTDAYLRAIVSAAGASADRALRQRSGPTARNQLAQADRLAKGFGINATPAFVVVRPGQPPQRFYYRSLSLRDFTAVLDAVLAGQI